MITVRDLYRQVEEALEREYYRQGSGAFVNPDGCLFCGGMGHATADCSDTKSIQAYWAQSIAAADTETPGGHTLVGEGRMSNAPRGRHAEKEGDL